MCLTHKVLVSGPTGNAPTGGGTVDYLLHTCSISYWQHMVECTGGASWPVLMLPQAALVWPRNLYCCFMGCGQLTAFEPLGCSAVMEK